MKQEHGAIDRSVATPDEIDVIELVGNGYTDAAIARRLNTSVVTVRRRATGCARKSGLRHVPRPSLSPSALDGSRIPRLIVSRERLRDATDSLTGHFGISYEDFTGRRRTANSTLR